MDQIARLQSWYASKCNGIWEHGFGITIDNIDNPGWRIVIPEGADERVAAIEECMLDDSADDDVWVHVVRRDRAVNICCGPNMLAQALEIFLKAVGQ